MTIGLTWKNLLSRGDITIQHDGLSLDDGLVTLVLICLFTDARADADDEIPDGSGDPRGWPGDTFSDSPWGSKLWLLEREKLTESVRQRVEDYARLSMQPLLRAGYARSADVVASIASFDRINFIVVLIRPDKSQLTIQLSRRWEATVNAI
ncbi:phage GP46 family protein [Edwardsiella piscicida]|uniref:phage GP46 family protein n=1 Tax=Edwardsiella piscicida TaxID=1263550 RepID=UPI000D517CCC|nr:phage GP46 family protein [Edwardsiella piscicida]UCQ39658.1 phage GP46 family protein [Edwardsiella piscicida]